MAADASKQVIAIASAVVAFTVTFIEKFRDPSSATRLVLIPLFIAWALLFLSIWFGLQNVLSLAANAESIRPGIIGQYTQHLALLQMRAFLLGMVCTAVYACLVLLMPTKTLAPQTVPPQTLSSVGPICGEEACDIMRRNLALGDMWNGCEARIGKPAGSTKDGALWIVSVFNKRRPPTVYGVDAYSGAYLGADPPHQFRACPQYPKPCPEPPPGCKPLGHIK